VIGIQVSRIGLLLLVLLLAGCEKHRLDEQVKELCAKDGGVRIYEVVPRPRAEFDEYGSVLIFDPGKGQDALGPEYVFDEAMTSYQSGDPQVSRSHYKVVRKSDGKVLGESVLYSRSGGDIPSPMYQRSFVCPPFNEAGVAALLKGVFRPS
jgi:hypothetical protein